MTKEPVFQKNGAETIQKQIDDAASDGTCCLTLHGAYEIEKTILLPSGFHLILEDCILRMKDGTMCQMFRNRNAESENGIQDCDIHLEGRGNAVLDGGTYNGLSERNENQDGRPPIHVNNLIFFVNLNRFSVTGLRMIRMRWYAMNLLFCQHGLLRDLDFEADDRTVMPDGTLRPGLNHHENYEAVYLKNADGIDLRMGCRDILIENITGFTEDDSIALNLLDRDLEQTFYREGFPRDIENVIIRNVRTATYCANIRLLNQSRYALRGILIDGLFDSSLASTHVDHPITGVRIGDAHPYGNVPPRPDQMEDITIRDVRTSADYGVYLIGAAKDVRVEHVTALRKETTRLKIEAEIENGRYDL